MVACEFWACSCVGMVKVTDHAVTMEKGRRLSCFAHFQMNDGPRGVP